MFAYNAGCGVSGPNFGTAFTAMGKYAAATIMAAKGQPGAADLKAEAKALFDSTKLTAPERQRLWSNMLQRSEREDAERKAALLKARNELDAQRLVAAQTADAAAALEEQQAALIPGMSNKTLVLAAVAVGVVFLFRDLNKPRGARR